LLAKDGDELEVHSPHTLEELTLAVAASVIDRDETTARLRRLLPEQR
jgi:hypothetical protein